MVKHLSSDDLRLMISRALHREPDEVCECSSDNGMMATYINLEHDSCPVYVPIVQFLVARYGVDEWSVTLSWNPYDWTYSAEVQLDKYVMAV